MSLRGNLNSVDLANIFQMLSINQKEGTLNIFDGGSKKSIYFSSEGVAMLSRGKANKDSLGQILLRYDRLTDEQLERALTLQKKSGKLLGVLLIENSIVSQEVIEDALRIQIEEEVYNLFIWKDASFEFIEGPPPAEFAEIDGALKRLTFNVNSLIMEAARRIDEWEQIQTLVPERGEIYRYSGQNMELSDDIFREPYCEKVLASINGKNQVDEIIDLSHVNRFEVCKVLSLLLDQGAIEAVPVADLASSAETAISRGEMTEAIKFLSRVLQLEGDTPKTHYSLGEAFEAVDEVGKSAHHYRLFAESELTAGEVEEPFRVYQKVCDLLPTDLPASDRLIEIYVANADEISIGPNAVIERGKNLSSMFLELGKNNHAVQTLHRVITLAPEDLSLRNQLINIYLANNMSAEAIEEYEAMVEYYSRKRDYEQVIILLRKILVIDRSREDLNHRLEQLISRKENQKRGLKRLLLTVVVIGGLAFLGYAYIDYELKARGMIALAEDRVAKTSSTISHEVGAALRELKLLQEGLDSPDSDPEALVATYREADELEGQYQAQIRAAISQLEKVAQEYRFTTARQQAVDRQAELVSMLTEFEGSVSLARQEIQARAELLAKQADGHLLDGQGTEALRMLKKAWVLALDKIPLKQMKVPEKIERLETDLARIAELMTEKNGHLSKGNYAEGREVALRLIEEFFVPEILDRVLLAVRVESVPVGADILVDGEPTGKRTPSWITWHPGRDLQVSLRLTGYEPHERLLQGVIIHNRQEELGRLKAGGTIKKYLAKVLNWQDSLDEPVEAAPAQVGGTVYLATRDSRIYSVTPKGRKKELVYQAKSLGGIISGPVAERGFLHLATIDGRLERVSLATKKSIWSKTLPGRVYAPLCVEGAFLLVGDLDGNLSAFEAETGILLWRRQTGGEVRSRPVVVDGKVYVATMTGHILAYELANGAPVMDLVPGEHGSSTLGSLLVHGGRLYVGSSDGALHAYDLKTRKEVWSYTFGAEIRAAPVMRNGVLLASAMDGRLYALKDGALVDTLELGGALPCSPTAVGNRIYVANDTGRVLCAGLAGGKLTELWRYDLGGDGDSPPRILVPMVYVDGLVLVVSGTGKVFVFDN